MSTEQLITPDVMPATSSASTQFIMVNENTLQELIQNAVKQAMTTYKTQPLEEAAQPTKLVFTNAEVRKVQPIPADVTLNRAINLARMANPIADNNAMYSLEGIDSMRAVCKSRYELAKTLKSTADNVLYQNQNLSNTLDVMKAIMLKRQWEKMSIAEFDQVQIDELLGESDEHETQDSLTRRIIHGSNKVNDAKSKAKSDPSYVMPADIKLYIARSELESAIRDILYNNINNNTKDQEVAELRNTLVKIMSIVDAFATAREQDRVKLPDFIATLITVFAPARVSVIPDVLALISTYKPSS